MYCKTAQNDPSAVRGARNYPCQEFPGKRAPTVALCRDPKGYVPIGTNPWRGPPIPYGHPGHERAEHLAAQQVSLHPAGRRPGSGDTDRRAASARRDRRAGPGAARSRSRCRRHPTPVGTRRPPGLDSACAIPAAEPGYTVPQGRSRRRHRRRDCPERRTRRPRSRGVRRPVRSPQANGTAYTTYDEAPACFSDPAGGTGIFAPAAKSSTAENWVDLMRIRGRCDPEGRRADDATPRVAGGLRAPPGPAQR